MINTNAILCDIETNNHAEFVDDIVDIATIVSNEKIPIINEIPI